VRDATRLKDYACLRHGLLGLYKTMIHERWFRAARSLADEMTPPTSTTHWGPVSTTPMALRP
jgi:uncharacterized protein YyaL (SSP411 family)